MSNQNPSFPESRHPARMTALIPVPVVPNPILERQQRRFVPRHFRHAGDQWLAREGGERIDLCA